VVPAFGIALVPDLKLPDLRSGGDRGLGGGDAGVGEFDDTEGEDGCDAEPDDI